jgi:uncharacterized protein YutE (UPF0331/DUF86 family)
MPIDAEARERIVLERLRDRYERKGYSFHLYPPRDFLPAFLGTYKPDAMSMKEKEGVIIEVKTRARRKEEDTKLSEIANRFKGQEGWTFQIVNIEDFPEQIIGVYRPDEIENELGKVERLAGEGQLRAAFILGWAALEAASRVLLSAKSENRSRPMLSDEVAEMLVRYGLTDQNSGRTLRELSRLRNAVVHGDLGQEVDENAITSLNQITRGLLDQLEAKVD